MVKKTVVATAAKGNQDKWLDHGLWYKLDTGSFESLAETVASQLLEKSNIQSQLGYQIVPYEVTKVMRHGQQRTACVSPNFLKEGQTIVTADHLLRRAVGADYQTQVFAKCRTYPQILETFVDVMVQVTGLVDFGAYLTLLFECDCLIRNVDRHLNNIVVLWSPEGYDYCPIFDNGASFLLNPLEYPLDVSAKSLVKGIKAQPFRYAFSIQVRQVRKLYGQQLQLTIAHQELAQIVDDQLHHYPLMYQGYLRE
ncbi:hypothetical protein RFF05_12920 [Bengtsoniella intestinalis]|uniref:hypothetical protein n=1 Tax=Bengtsoniella intestinalis TaxID=3073143 RepID=UPI00391F536B